MIGLYKNHPGGLGGMSENLKKDMHPVVLEDVAESGNRAQRRWARKHLAELARKEARNIAARGKRKRGRNDR